MERLLRASELAELLDVSVITLKKWRHRGYGPAYKRLLGERGEIRYRESDVLEFMGDGLNKSYAEERSKAQTLDVSPSESEDETKTPNQNRRFDQGRGVWVVTGDSA
jgi:phage terminase Nu1 subunit (DNA packaging protein)